MFQYISVLLLCIYAVSATEYRNCTADPTKNGAISVTVSGCDVLPCPFYRGTDLINDVEFSSPIDSETITPLVFVTISGLEVEYPLPNPNACFDLTSGGCPLSLGEVANYHLVMPILASYPLVTMTIEFNLIGDGGTVLTCIEVDGYVTDP